MRLVLRRTFQKSEAPTAAPITLAAVADAPHLLIVGASGSGKSSIVRAILKLRSGNAIVCDPHDATDRWSVPSIGGGEDWRAILYLLHKTKDEMTRRYQTPLAEGEQPPARHTLVLDELRALLQHAPESAAIIRDILARGRAAGIGLIVVAHDDTASALGLTDEYALIHNYSYRIYLGQMAREAAPAVAQGANPRVVFDTAAGSWRPLRVPARLMLRKSKRNSIKPGHKWLARERSASGKWQYTYHQQVTGAAPHVDPHGHQRQQQLLNALTTRKAERQADLADRARVSASPPSPTQKDRADLPPPGEHIDSRKRRSDQSPTKYPDRTYAPGSIFASRAAALHTVESSLAGKQIEHAYLVKDLPDGRATIVSYHIGDKGSVAFSDDDLDRFPGATLTHNHPSNNSFSPEDVYVLLENRLQSIRAVTATQSYVIERTPNALPIAEAQRQIEAYHLKVRAQFMHAIREGRMSPDQASASHWHTVWSHIAPQVGLHYSVEPL